MTFPRSTSFLHCNINLDEQLFESFKIKVSEEKFSAQNSLGNFLLSNNVCRGGKERGMQTTFGFLNYAGGIYL